MLPGSNLHLASAFWEVQRRRSAAGMQVQLRAACNTLYLLLPRNHGIHSGRPALYPPRPPTGALIVSIAPAYILVMLWKDLL